jgi:uncharacterized membrane protein
MNRIRLLDLLRAMAVIAMIFYHFAYDLADFGYVSMIIVVNGYWKLFAQSIGCSFLFVSGISFWVMASGGIIWSKYFKRMAVLIAAALLISITTYQINSSTFIFFGILHLLAACSLFSVFIYRLPVIVLLILGVGIIFLPEYYHTSSYYNNTLFANKLLAWTGLFNGKTGSVDFYAFMPWSAAFVFGLACSKVFIKPGHPSTVSPLSFKEEKATLGLSSVLWIGRNSLLVYLIHQPILIGIIICFQKLFGH